MERGRRQGRRKKSWEDNIREWAGLEFAKSQRAVENREKWKNLIVKSSTTLVVKGNVTVKFAQDKKNIRCTQSAECDV